MTFFRANCALLFLLFLSACSTTPRVEMGGGGQPGPTKPSPTVNAQPQTPIGECRFEKGKVGRAYQIRGVTYTPKHDPDYVDVGTASYYGEYHHGKSTANGETFNMNGLSAAHTTLPLPSCVLVTNLNNNKSVILRVNDRGPFVDSRIIDVSYRAAQVLDFVKSGLARVRVEVINASP